MCRHFSEDFGLETRVARYHNVYGPIGTFDGGREKAPAALCRKIAIAKIKDKNEIEVWGDGEQTRSYLFVDDCLDKGVSTENIYKHFSEYQSVWKKDNLSRQNKIVDLMKNMSGYYGGHYLRNKMPL